MIVTRYIKDDIRKEMERKHISQRRLADALGVTEGYVSQWIHGDTDAYISRTLRRVADVLGCRIDIRMYTEGEEDTEEDTPATDTADREEERE